MRGAFFPLAYMQNKWSKLLCFSFQSCVTFWLWGTLAPGTASDLSAIWNRDEFPGYRTAPTGATLFFFLATFLFKPKGMSMRSPFCSHPAPSPFNIYLCNRSEKSKCPSQGTPRANTVVHCMPDGLQHPPPIMHTRPSHHHQHHTTPRTDKAEPQLTVSKWVSECEQANEHTPAAVSDLGLNTQTQSVYTMWHLRQLFLIEYCGIGSDKRKLIHVSREPVTTLFTVDLSGELY